MNKMPASIFTGSRDFNSAIYALSSEVPDISLVEIGQSVMGAPILAVFLGSGARRVIYSAAHHGNEWLTAPLLLRFLEEAAYREDLFYLRSSSTLCFIPLVNPDGADLASGALKRGAYYDAALKIANNYPDIPFPEGWKANIRGIDLNLQYPARWETARELKLAAGFTSSAPRDFVGDYPLQAQEAAALARFTEDFLPDTLVALHSQGEVIYYMSNGYYPEETFPLASEMAAASGYALDSTPSFSDNAGYKDWFIDRFKRPGFTIEVGKGENPLPVTDFDGIYKKLAPMLLLCATNAPGT